MKKFIKPQPTEASPFVVDNYPYGFKLRTKIRYWVETNKKGQRVLSQTLNPKTQKWNKPKPSIYGDMIFLYKDEREHIKSFWLSPEYTEEQDYLEQLKEIPAELIGEYQKERIKTAKAIFKTREHITLEIVETTGETKEQRTAREKEQAKTKANIGSIFNHYYNEESV